MSNFMIHLHTVCMFTTVKEIPMHHIKQQYIKQGCDEYVKIERFGLEHSVYTVHC